MPDPTPWHHRRTLLWHALAGQSSEICHLWRAADQLAGARWRLTGTIVLLLDERPAEVRYQIDCDGDWQTRDVAITLCCGAEERTLDLTADSARRWTVDGVARPDLDGCADIDLSLTPASNTLPIRRLTLPVGDAAAVTAAWVRFPTLVVAPLHQRYQRLNEHDYRYESDGGFAALLTVDQLGLVTTYSGGWERLAAE